jgi:hypothetical protein
MAQPDGTYRGLAHQGERLGSKRQLGDTGPSQARPELSGARAQLAVRGGGNGSGTRFNCLDDFGEAAPARLDATEKVAQLGEQPLELAGRRIVALGIAARGNKCARP